MSPEQNDRQVSPQPQITTPPIQTSEHTWTIQAIMRLENSIGALNQSVLTLVKQAEANDQKHDQIKEAVARIDKKLYAAGIIVTLLIVVGGFVVNKAVDFGMEMAKEAIRAPNVAPPADPPSLKRK